MLTAELLLNCLHFLIMNTVLLKTFCPRSCFSCNRILLPAFSVAAGLADHLLFNSGCGFMHYFLMTLFLYEIFTICFLTGKNELKVLLSLILIVYKILLVPIGDILSIQLVGGYQPMSGFPHLVSKLIIALFLLPIAAFLVRFRIPNREGDQEGWNLLTSIFSLVIMLNLLFLVQTLPDSASNFGYNLCMILVVTVCYYMLYRLKLSFYQELDYRIRLEQQHCQEIYTDQVKTSHENLCKLRHDFKNHILYMKLMLKNGEYQQLDDYFQELTEKFTNTKQVVNTGNFLVNAIINTKILSVADDRIPIEVHASLPDILPLSDTDTVSLISNLFDNAVEASLKENDPWISIRMEPYKGYLRFQFENAAKQNIPKTGDALKTIKPDKQNHGFGLKIIQEIVEQHGGSMHIHAENNVFRVQILIPHMNAETAVL